MFTWVCQRCGKDVDIAEIECPHCKAESGVRGAALGSPSAPRMAPPPESPAPVVEPEEDLRPPPGPKPLAPEAPPLSVSGRLLALFGSLLALSIAGALYLARPQMFDFGFSLPKLPSFSRAAPPPLQDGPVEIAGVRAWRDEKSILRVRAVVVNHTDGAFGEPLMTVSLRHPDADPAGPPAATFEAKLDSPLPARSSREIETELLAPEGLTALPPWNRLIVEIEIPGPPEAEPSE